MWLFSFGFPSKKFLPISFKIQRCNFSPKTEGTKTKAATVDVSFFWFLFPSYSTFWMFCNSQLFTFCQVCLLVKETAGIETGMAEKSSWAETKQTYGKNLVWFGEIERKLAKLSKTTFTVLTVLPLNYFMDTAYGWVECLPLHLARTTNKVRNVPTMTTPRKIKS
jgi:hypothetical protein